MSKATPLKGLGFLANGILLFLVAAFALVILVVSGIIILSGFVFLIEAVLKIAFGIWKIIPFWGSETKIWGIEGSIPWGALDLIGASLVSGLGWGIFHFLFPEEKKPKRLRRKRRAKKNPASVRAATP